MVKFKIGAYVVKQGEDSRFEGEVVSVFAKRNGTVRYVVENDDGVLHIASERMLRHGLPKVVVTSTLANLSAGVPGDGVEDESPPDPAPTHKPPDCR